MTTAEQRLVDALAVLEALKPFQGTGWDAAKLSSAWDEARRRAGRAIDDFLAEKDNVP